MQKVSKHYLILIAISIVIQIIGIACLTTLQSDNWINVWQMALLIVLIIESKIYVKYPTRINFLTLVGLGGIQLLMLILFIPILFKQYDLITQLDYIYESRIDFYLLILFVIIQIVQLFLSYKISGEQDKEDVPKYIPIVALIILIVIILSFIIFSAVLFSPLPQYSFLYYGLFYYGGVVMQESYLGVWNGLLFVLYLSQVVLYQTRPQVEINKVMYRMTRGLIWVLLLGLGFIVLLSVSYTFQNSGYSLFSIGLLLGLGMEIYGVIFLIGVCIQVCANIKYFLVGEKSEESIPL